MDPTKDFTDISTLVGIEHLYADDDITVLERDTGDL
jgi:hypothetical protein